MRIITLTFSLCTLLGSIGLGQEAEHHKVLNGTPIFNVAHGFRFTRVLRGRLLFSPILKKPETSVTAALHYSVPANLQRSYAPNCCSWTSRGISDNQLVESMPGPRATDQWPLLSFRWK
jgi:hypothetical protein